jgi:hypothetical protein
MRAAEIRAAQTHEDVFAATSPFLGESEPETEDAGVVAAPRPRSGIRTSTTRSQSRAAARPVVAVRKLTREQEYSFIKADLRRLLITAGSLAVAMIVVLFVIEM